MFHCSPCWIFNLIFLYLNLTYCHNTFSQLHIWNKTISLLFKIKQLKLALDLIELVHDTEPLHFYCKKPTLGAEALMFILYADPLSFSRPRSRGRLFFPKITRCFYSKCSKIGVNLNLRVFCLKVSTFGCKPVSPLFFPKSPTSIWSRAIFRFFKFCYA